MQQTIQDVREPNRLLNRNFVLLWQGQFVSRLGTQIVLVALVFWVKHVTGSASLMGIIQMASSIPVIILAPFGGVIADRFSRRRIIILADVVRGLASISLAALMFTLPDATGLSIAWLFVVLVVSGVMGGFFDPAISASIPDIVPKREITSANSLGQLSFQISTFLGQGIGGLLFRILGAPMLFLIDGLSYLFSAGSESLIQIPQNVPERSANWHDQFEVFKADIREGFDYVWQRPGLRQLVFISAFLTFFTMPIIVLLPFYVEDYMGVSSDWYGYLLAVYSAGSLVGFLIAGSIKLSGKARLRWMILLLILQSAGHGLIGLVTQPMLVMVLAFVGGATNGFITIHITTILQLTTPTNIRGRVFGLLAMISGSLAPVAMGLAGVVADLVNQNIPLIYVVCGAAMVALSVMISLSPEFHRFVRYAGEDVMRERPEQRVVPLSGQPSMLGRSALSESVLDYLSSERLSQVLIAASVGLVLGVVAIVVSPLWALAVGAGFLALIFLIMS